MADDIDDLTETTCARCGTEYELHRPNGLVFDGRFYGEVVCTSCVPLDYHEGPCRYATTDPTTTTDHDLT